MKSNEEQDLNFGEELDSEQLTESSEDLQPSEEEGVVTEEPISQPIVEEVVPVKKPECRLHKLTSEYYGNFKQTTKEELEKEIPTSRKNDLQKIKTECEAKGNQDIFVSNKNSTGWRYYPEDQSRLKGKFDKYLATLNTQRR
ncbi:hypothetical protein HF1_06370 [Mycoplasma haemofelis str. Langford 1]|uniref:Uncharacterized protein n=1 Tax=Mycoplasma haemofelis (strain Langford 1) TaxID=941640 RepID=E8ZHM4_MYCHL|nr:hypothetical protein [Mycoplasma haemofelis]CBY92645.1 hypothetical protein HF1_06370 [Mycoplasma haemofelis str. Langford 1]